jgi:tetratricopeptide (TPR) repeat protein
MARPLSTLIHACTACLLSTTLLAQPPAGDDLLKQGQERLRNGDLTAALEIYERAARTDPSSVQAHLQAGIVLDLLGRYTDARTHITRAIETASTPEDRDRADRTMAMSYAFERNCSGAEQYEKKVYDRRLAEKQYADAAEIANELARVCLESDAIDRAETWYRTGHEQALEQPDLTPAQRDLWDFRWEHAQARIAARRGNAAEARTHVTAAKQLLDKGTNPNQAPFFPYLVGYVAFYGGDYETALTELQKANQDDPFILSLIAQTYEKLGNKDQATATYRKVLESTAHNPTGAFARPLAQKKVGTN